MIDRYYQAVPKRLKAGHRPLTGFTGQVNLTNMLFAISAHAASLTTVSFTGRYIPRLTLDVTLPDCFYGGSNWSRASKTMGDVPPDGHIVDQISNGEFTGDRRV